MSLGFLAIAILTVWAITLGSHRREAIKALNYFRRQVVLEADLAHQLAALSGGRVHASARENLERVIASKGDEVYGEAHYWARHWATTQADSRLLRDLQSTIRRADFTLDYYDRVAFDWNRALSRPWNRMIALVMGWEPLPCLSCLSPEEVRGVETLLITAS